MKPAKHVFPLALTLTILAAVAISADRGPQSRFIGIGVPTQPAVDQKGPQTRDIALGVPTPATTQASQRDGAPNPDESGLGTPVPGGASASPASVRSKAIENVLEGKFSDALAMLNDGSLASDPAAAKARQLMADYLSVRERADKERQANLRVEEARVQLARLAQKQRPALVEGKPGDPQLDASRSGTPADPVYEKIEAIADALIGVDKLVGVATTSQPAEVMPEVQKSVDKARTDLAEAVKLVGAGQGAWGKAFGDRAKALNQAMDGYLAAAGKARMPQDWPTVKRAVETMQDVLVDLGVLVSREPLMSALSHAREAKELADDESQFLQQGWVKDLIAECERHGDELMAQGKWNDALSIYGHSGLSALDDFNARYKDIVKKISQHVRVLSLYGREAAATQPTAKGTPNPDVRRDVRGPQTLPASDEPRWREMIANIDTDMVRHAINQIDDNYVERPDYRKMGAGAMEALKILVESKESRGAFPSLSDEGKRNAFLQAVDTQLSLLKGKDTVDHLDLSLALDRLLKANAATADLPPEVVDMEFAEGMLGQIDEFSGMIWPYEEDDFNKRTMGSFFGIGVQIHKEAGKPIEVVTPLPDSPALTAGILAGDLIVRVDGRETDAMTVDRAVKLITGPRHTKVNLTIRRQNRPKLLELVVERDEIHMQTVKGWRMLPDGKWNYFIDPENKIAYLRVTQFTSDTTEEMRQALKAARQGGAASVILDLRFNPGGLLTGAVDMADEFLRRGLIVRTGGRNSPEGGKDATALGEFQDGKVLVLVNRYSASAAEIVSGALKDWRRAELVGERTYGKGSVQRLIPLKANRAKLKLTTAYYYLPSGRCLHRTNGAKDWGVDPDVRVPVSVRQMNRWAEIRQETDLLKSIEPERLTTLLSEQLAEDLQLQTALMLLRMEELGPTPTYVGGA